VNYYLNGHGNKLQMDLSIFSAEDLGVLPLDAYTGLMNVAYGAAGEDLGVLLRFQWQLAL